MVEDRIIEEFVSAIRQEPKPEVSSMHDAIVSRIDEQGKIWVRIAGSDTETPTVSSSSEVDKDDRVTVQWRNNRLYILGNSSNPSAGSIRVDAVEQATNAARLASQSAVKDAGVAAEAAADAKATADSVKGIASDAQTAATEAQSSASNASEYASRALGNLSTVQNVAETLNWITKHGTMELTTDTALDPTHVYFVLDENGDYTVGNNRYSVVTEPDVAAISTYYELRINQSLNNYVATHLAVDTEGLWILPGDEGNKVLIATGSGSTYTKSGTYIIGKVNGTDTVFALFGADGTQIGQSDETHTIVDYRSLQLFSKEGGDPYFKVTDMRGPSGEGTVTDTFHLDYGISAVEVTVSKTVLRVISVSVQGVDVTGDDRIYTQSGKTFIFDTREFPNPKNQVDIKYATSDPLRAFTFGSRGTGIVEDAGINFDGVGDYSFTEGSEAVASGFASHAEGHGSIAAGQASHAEGTTGSEPGLGMIPTIASGFAAHAEGCKTLAKGSASHSEGTGTKALGDHSHAQNIDTIAGYDAQTVIGRYNDNKSDTAFEIGNGTADDARSNAFEVDWDGNVKSSGAYETDETASQGFRHIADGNNQTIRPVGLYAERKDTGVKGWFGVNAGGSYLDMYDSTNNYPIIRHDPSTHITSVRKIKSEITGEAAFVHSVPSGSYAAFRVENSSNGNAVELQVGSGGTNRGVYLPGIGWMIYYDGSETRINNLAVDSGSCTIASGWANYESGQGPIIRKQGSVVSFYWQCKPTSSKTIDATRQTVCTIPAGYRPPRMISKICQGTGTRIFEMTVQTNGNVQVARLRNTNSTSYDTADSSYWFPLHMTWIVD